MDVQGRRVLVVGLARSGQAVAHCLVRRGAVVTATDQRHPSAFSNEIVDLMRQRVGLELGCHREQTFLRQDLIVVSPGVPADLAPLQLARRKGIPVVPEVEVASWFLKGRLAGITGTNGKTTTTALAGKILEASGFNPFVGGNIGVPLISALDREPEPSVLVVELSSFQLETIRTLRPRVAVLLNLTPNHLDRHSSFEAYIAAKARIFENQTEDDFAILNADDASVMKLVPSIRSRKVFFSRRRELADGLFVADGRIRYRVRHLELSLLEVRDVRLRGGFNLENVLASCAVACVLGADFAALRLAVRDFRAVEHRLEFVREIAGVAFYNDSKATSVDAASNALATFDHGVHLILGGKDKGAPYTPLRPLLRNRVREVLSIGAAAEKIERELAPAAEIHAAGTLENAVRKAFERAEPGDTILLSPACSSYDQFENFEERGKHFKELAATLAAETSEKRARAASPSAMKKSVSPEPPAPSEKDLFSAADAEVILDSSQSREKLSAESVGEGETGEKAHSANGRGTAEQAAEEFLDLPRPRAERELEYVYEMSAEEIFGEAADVDLTRRELLETESQGSRLGAELEPLDDEAMGYEVRHGARGADSKAASGRPATKAFPASGKQGK